MISPQLAIKEEVLKAPTIDAIISGHPMYIHIAVHYVRPRQVTYVRDALQGIIRELIDTDDLDLEADPSLVDATSITCRFHD